MGLNLRLKAILNDEYNVSNDRVDHDTNHARGYIIFPTARRDAVAPMSDEAFDGFAFGSMYGECMSGPFVKDAR